MTGLTGSAVLQNNGGDPLSITVNGSFSFEMPIAAGSRYSVTVKTQPSGQTCTVSNGSGTAGTSDVTDVVLECVTNAQTLGGTVSGLNGSMVLQYNAGHPQTITANGVFAFAMPVAEGSPYDVTVRTQPTNETCTVAHASGIVAAAGVTGVAVTCIANAYTVGGSISGLAGTVVLQNNGADTQSIGTDGSFTFPTPVQQGSSYSVTVATQPAGETCSVANGSGPMGAARVTSVAVVCAVNTRTIGGTVAGLTGTVVLQDNGADSQTLGADGGFTFATPLAQGGTYSVTVQTQPAAQTCTVSNGAGPVGNADINNVSVTCSTNAYTVGGTVSGLNGTVTLQNNGANSTPIGTNGSFTFSTPIAEGSPYDSTVQAQPTAQTCTVSNGSGIVGGSNVTNLAVTCVTNTTTITVDSTGVIPVNGASGSVTVTNTGTTYAALNVSATLPGGWTGVTQDSSNCTMIMPNGGTCTLTFISTTPYVAEGNITVGGDNIASPPTTAVAFSIDGYLVFGVPSGSSALIVASSDASASLVWSPAYNNIPGITEISMAPPCNGDSDGACDTGQIVALYGTPYSNYAAGLCDEITSDNSGAVVVGTWYLPSMCEMGASGQGAACGAGIANIDSNLVQLGFITLSATYYWSSTEYSGIPTGEGAWAQHFASAGASTQGAFLKNDQLSVRCVRAISY